MYEILNVHYMYVGLSIIRAIYLSGGVTMLPGFADRLQCELQKLAPPSVMVEVGQQWLLLAETNSQFLIIPLCK